MTWPKANSARNRHPRHAQWFEQDVAGVASAAVLVRNLVEAHLIGWDLKEMVDDAVLVADELFANAMQAAPGQAIGLRVALLERFVVVEVEDPSPGRAAPREADDEGGRGLMIVDALSAYWGQRPEPGGKTVYALLAIPRNG
ncbi:ATP-binding protein [Actinomadura gamaensis]|uniref:ATP-binding protein n=1 Tax=Actinomadura gamaensis TaxID=1763541 RepID=A0ABV9U863_9ACTN